MKSGCRLIFFTAIALVFAYCAAMFDTAEEAALNGRPEEKLNLTFFLSTAIALAEPNGQERQERGSSNFINPLNIDPASADRGEGIFSSRCMPCHSVGGGAVVGPDLIDLNQRRPYSWLLDFISDPERMFRQNDPIAMDLLAEYQVEMPDLGLSDLQINDVLAYISSKSGPLPSNDVSGDATPPSPAPEEMGEAMFRENCAMCHTVGGGDKVGPDLAGVTKERSHEWLVSFILNPGKLFEEKDPIAMSLLAKYDGLKMPAGYLNKPQIEDVLAYIESES